MKNSAWLPILLTGLAFLVARPILNLPPQPIRFVEEHIRMDVTGTHLDVQGTYTYQNDSWFPRNQKMFYPFWMKDGAVYPKQIEVHSKRGTQSSPLLFRQVEDGVIYTVAMPRQERSKVFVHYRQKLSGNKATYIVTTTKSWKRPLDHAVFDICWKKELAEPTLSYDAVPIEAPPGKQCRRIDWQNHMPDKEIELTWRSP